MTKIGNCAAAIALFAATAALADDTEFYQTVDRTTVGTEDTFRLTIVAVNPPGNSQIQLQRRPQTVTIPNSAAVGPAGTSPTPANTDGQATFYVPSTKTN